MIQFERLPYFEMMRKLTADRIAALHASIHRLQLVHLGDEFPELRWELKRQRRVAVRLDGRRLFGQDFATRRRAVAGLKEVAS